MWRTALLGVEPLGRRGHIFSGRPTVDGREGAGGRGDVSLLRGIGLVQAVVPAGPALSAPARALVRAIRTVVIALLMVAGYRRWKSAGGRAGCDTLRTG